MRFKTGRKSLTPFPDLLKVLRTSVMWLQYTPKCQQNILPPFDIEGRFPLKGQNLLQDFQHKWWILCPESIIISSSHKTLVLGVSVNFSVLAIIVNGLSYIALNKKKLLCLTLLWTEHPSLHFSLYCLDFYRVHFTVYF